MWFTMDFLKCIIESKEGANVVQPLQDVRLSQNRDGSPCQLKLSLQSDLYHRISHGDVVYIYLKGVPLFRGFVFTIDYNSKNQAMDLTCYDQTRYLYNPVTYIFNNMFVDEIVTEICSDLGLHIGKLDSTGVQLSSDGSPLIFNGVPAIDIIRFCIEKVRYEENRLLTIYDDFGKLTLQDVSEMVLNEVLEPHIIQDISTTTTINEKTFNQVTFTFGSATDQAPTETVTVSGDNLKDIGILIKYHRLEETDTINPEQMEEIGKKILKVLNNPSRKLKLNGVLGNTKLKAGYYVPVSFERENIKETQFYNIVNIEHIIKNGVHTMDLILEGVDAN